jgi:hypothetical protein
MRLLALFLLVVPLLAQAGPLNDTGIHFCRDPATGVFALVNATTTCGTDQDARVGRDAAATQGALAKVGDGSKGFDFTKIANNGSSLPASAALGSNAADWACTYDNNTGLMWEVKTSDGGLRDLNWSYAMPALQSAQGGVTFDAAVNSVGLCGHNDWRFPTVNELVNLADLGIAYPGPTIDSGYFPNTPGVPYWSSEQFYPPSATVYGRAVDFGGGIVGQASQSNWLFARLVRAGK